MTGRVLLTGATGFVGRHALEPLRARGFEVHAVARRAPDVQVDDAGIHWHAADLFVPGAPAALVRDVRPTHLLHLAWYVEHGAFWRSPENLRWVGASLDLVRAFVEHGGARVVTAGTCAEYEWGHDAPCREGATPERPSTVYGASKLALHIAVAAYARDVGLSAATGRMFLLYGPGESPARLVPSVAAALLRGEPARCSHGAQRRDLLHVGDVADAFAALLASDVQGAVNIASGEGVALREVVSEVASAAGAPELVRFGALPAAPNDPPVLVADVTRLRTEVGWRPSIALSEGIGRTVAWWRDRLATTEMELRA